MYIEDRIYNLHRQDEVTYVQYPVSLSGSTFSPGSESKGNTIWIRNTDSAGLA